MFYLGHVGLSTLCTATVKSYGVKKTLLLESIWLRLLEEKKMDHADELENHQLQEFVGL